MPLRSTPCAAAVGPRRRARVREREGFQNAGSCCGAVVFVDQSAEQVAALDVAAAWLGVRTCRVGREQRESAVWALAVVVGGVDAEHCLEVAASDYQQPVETLGTDGADEGMEPLWSPVVATGGKRRQMARRQKPREQAKTVAVDCHRLPAKFHGRQGVCRRLPPVAGGPLPVKEGVDLHVGQPRLISCCCSRGTETGRSRNRCMPSGSCLDSTSVKQQRPGSTDAVTASPPTARDEYDCAERRRACDRPACGGVESPGLRTRQRRFA